MGERIPGKYSITALAIFMIWLAVMAGCSSPVTTTPPPIISAWPPLTSSNTPTPLPPDLRPVEVVSVEDTYKSGQTVNPGGPEIEIALRT